MKIKVSTVGLPMKGSPDAAEKMAQVTDEAETIELPEGSTVADLVHRLDVPVEHEEMALVNGAKEGFGTVLHDGDAVSFIGPAMGM